MKFEQTITGKKNTVKTYLNIYKKQIKPYLAPEKAKSIKSVQELQYLHKYWDGYSDNTKYNISKVLKKYLAFVDNPMDVKSLFVNNQQVNTPPKAMTEEQAKKFLQVACRRGNKVYIVALLGLHAGMRKGEIKGLQWGDVDLKNKKILIQRSCHGPTKNNKSRIVEMSHKVAKQLNIWYNITGDKKESALVLPRVNIDKSIKDIFKTIGLPHMSCHSLRHTFASLGLNSGKVNIKEMQQLLGHSNPSITMNIYWSNLNPKADLSFLPDSGEDDE